MFPLNLKIIDPLGFGNLFPSFKEYLSTVRGNALIAAFQFRCGFPPLAGNEERMFRRADDRLTVKNKPDNRF